LFTGPAAVVEAACGGSGARFNSMSPATVRRAVLTGASLILGILLGACGGSDPAGPSETLNLTGHWSGQQQARVQNCGHGDEQIYGSGSYEVQMQQTGRQLEVHRLDGGAVQAYAGSLDGSHVSYTGTGNCGPGQLADCPERQSQCPGTRTETIDGTVSLDSIAGTRKVVFHYSEAGRSCPPADCTDTLDLNIRRLND
jgi:hypothetical protein